jgi:hypothetical protein
MTDKEKDLNQEQDKSGAGLKVEFKPSGEKTEPFVVKKTPDQIKIENSQSTSNPLDINTNLGSFGSNDVVPPISTEKVATLEKIQEKNDQLPTLDNDNVKINFHKFERNKNVQIKTKLGSKLDN